MTLKLFFLITIISFINQSTSLSVKNEATTSHLIDIEQSHNLAKKKQYKFLYTPKIDPKIYLGDFGPTPRIMKYLPLVNKEGEIKPYNTNIEEVKRQYLAKLKYDKVVDNKKANQLISFLSNEIGKSLLTYFQDLARGGLNFYKMTEEHYKKWLAIKIIAGKDTKMYARSIVEDIELFKQFYINSRNRKIEQVRGIPEGPKQPMKYIPPVKKNAHPPTKIELTNQTKTKTAFQNIKPLNKDIPQTNNIIKDQTKSSKAPSFNNNQVITIKKGIVKQKAATNRQSSTISKSNNKQRSAETPSIKTHSNPSKNAATNQGTVLNTQKSINYKKNVSNGISNTKTQTFKQKTSNKILNQVKLPLKVQNRQSVVTAEVKNLPTIQKKQEKKTVKIMDIKKAQQPNTEIPLQIIPSSKIQAYEYSNDRTFIIK